MTQFVEVRHSEWIQAPIDTVSTQFADLEHHIRHNVHPKLHVEALEKGAHSARYVQEVRLFGIHQRDVFERRIEADGSIIDESVEGFNKGGSLKFRFLPETLAGKSGTRVHINVRLPIPPLVGPLLRPLLEAQIRKEVAVAAQEDRMDIEQHGYPRTVSPGA